VDEWKPLVPTRTTSLIRPPATNLWNTRGSRPVGPSPCLWCTSTSHIAAPGWPGRTQYTLTFITIPPIMNASWNNHKGLLCNG
jgi:hypothetical protein